MQPRVLAKFQGGRWELTDRSNTWTRSPISPLHQGPPSWFVQTEMEQRARRWVWLSHTDIWWISRAPICFGLCRQLRATLTDMSCFHYLASAPTLYPDTTSPKASAGPPHAIGWLSLPFPHLRSASSALHFCLVCNSRLQLLILIIATY